MPDAQDASEAARSLANVRWRGQVISRAIAELARRSGELSAAQLAQLAPFAGGMNGDISLRAFRTAARNSGSLRSQ
jgi:hypothetical protein